MRSRLVFACARPTLFALEASGCRVCSSLITCWLSIATWMRPGSWAGTEEFSAKKIRVSMRSAGLCRSTGKCLYLRTVPLRLSPRAGGSFYALRRVVPRGYPRCCCQDCFPRIVYTPPRELTNFTSQPRVASLFRCCLTGAEILMNPTRKNSSCSFGRKFYIIVHFFLSIRRPWPLFFIT